jgi:peptidyl-prolyl cis-trans isomerase C
LLNEAKKKGIDKRKDVKKAIENAKKQIITNALIADAISKEKITVSDKEISDYYNANKGSFKDTQGKPVPLATVKPYIEQKLLAEKQKKAIDNYINSLKKTHKVNYAK